MLSEWQLQLYGSQPEYDYMIEMGILLKAAISAYNDGLEWSCPIDEALRFSKWYYTYHGAGGWLHIVLDDENLMDDQVDYCIKRADREGDIVCKMLALLIRTMSEDEREVLYNRLWQHD